MTLEVAVAEALEATDTKPLPSRTSGTGIVSHESVGSTINSHKPTPDTVVAAAEALEATDTEPLPSRTQVPVFYLMKV